ncbi:hypothetical protein BH10PSE19_BH10PSE19_05640 [soil metagenome]
MVQNQIWDLVIINIELMGPNILDTIKLIKSANHWTTILILTNYQQIEHTAEALQGHEHADGVLFKPLVKTTFLDLALKLITNTKNSRQKEQKVILAIGAHPDDVEIGCGGTLARHQTEGAIINILTLSLGEVGGEKNIRCEESQLAAKVLQAKLFLGDLTDTRISDGVETIRLIENIVQEIKPTHVYTHSRHDTHQDHRNVHLAAMVACRSISNLFCYQSPSATIDFRPNLFIDISDYLPQKLAALASYKSQVNLHLYITEEMIRAMSLYWGRFANGSHAEPMEIIRQQYR